MAKRKDKSGTLINPKTFSRLFNDISSLIEQSRKNVALHINSEMVTVNWRIGTSINVNILENKRAEYGKAIISRLSDLLTSKYGSGYSIAHLTYCRTFAAIYPNEQIVHAMREQLSWTHIRIILSIKDEIKREFYLQLCIKERWKTRFLEERIDSMLFERTALSKKPDELIKKELTILKSDGTVTSDLVFRDPYVLDFLGLKDTYSEFDLESAILRQLQKFITELGSDFAFIARQKMITIDKEDFRIDLLFYHRGLRRLVAIDLKLDRFKAAYKGQMELYLKWLDKYERKEGEETPVGLILCAQKQQEQIELLELNHGHIRVAEYLTQLPSKELLAQKLQRAIEIARNTGKKK
ncbi:MAG TPA: PDDEXK nuclease domain-containing protein [Chitinophagaceae bacterium]|jgi:predicted nuclease of restriction endonuclease-like (RecB) superfamily|nr:PDDEXK nuclease domain-containing protein [Chitinophagaceae bacterium]